MVVAASGEKRCAVAHSLGQFEAEDAVVEGQRDPSQRLSDGRGRYGCWDELELWGSVTWSHFRGVYFVIKVLLGNPVLRGCFPAAFGRVRQAEIAVPVECSNRRVFAAVRDDASDFLACRRKGAAGTQSVARGAAMRVSIAAAGGTRTFQTSLAFRNNRITSHPESNSHQRRP